MAIPAWFDGTVYLDNKLAQMRAKNPEYSLAALEEDLRAAGYAGDEGAYGHFTDYGAAEGLSPNSLFDVDAYYQSKAALEYGTDSPSALQIDAMRDAFRNAGLDPWTHYTHYGTKEGVNASGNFNTVKYLEAKLEKLQSSDAAWAAKKLPELAQVFADAGINALQHYLLYGRYESIPGFSGAEIKPPVKPGDKTSCDALNSAPGEFRIMSMDYAGRFDLGADSLGRSMTANGGFNTFHTGNGVTVLVAEGSLYAENSGVNRMDSDDGKSMFSLGKDSAGLSLTAVSGGSNVMENGANGESIIVLSGGLKAEGGVNSVNMKQGLEMRVGAANDGLSLNATGSGSNTLVFEEGAGVLILKGGMSASGGGLNSISMGGGSNTLLISGTLDGDGRSNLIDLGPHDGYIGVDTILGGTEIRLGDGHDGLRIEQNLSATGDILLDGGSGVDYLSLEQYGNNATIRLSELGTRAKGFETLSVGGKIANTVVVQTLSGWGETFDNTLLEATYSGLDKKALEEAERVLRIFGDTNDTVSFDGQWSKAGDLQLYGVDYAVYGSHSATGAEYVVVESGMAVTFA